MVRSRLSCQRRGASNVGCLAGLFLIAGLFVAIVFVGGTLGSALGMKGSPDPSWLLIAGFVAVVLGGFIYLQIDSQIDDSARQTKAAEEKARQEEEKRRREEKWNSSEEVERRRLEAERLQAQREEQERRRKEEEERVAREKWALYHQHRKIEEVDAMSGREFEWFMKNMLERLSFKNVVVTAASGDKGGDLTCDSPKGEKAVVQAKRWKGKVGIRAIQEVIGAIHFYSAEIAYVTTNSHFTLAAKALAKMVPSVTLWDREVLDLLIEAVFPATVPEFNWDKFNAYVRGWQPRPPPPGKNARSSGTPRSYGRKPRRKPGGGYRRYRR